MRSLLPQRVFVKLRCQTPFYSVTTNSAFGYFDIRGNSPRDPYLAFGGPGCRYYDWYAQQYDKFRCYGAKIRVSFYNLQTQDGLVNYNVPAACGIIAYKYAGGNPSISNMRALLEDPAVRWKHVRPIRPSNQVATTVTYKVLTKDIMGVKNVQDDTALAAVVTTDPISQWMFRVFAGTLQEFGTIPATWIGCRMTIVYFTEFYDRKLKPVPTSLFGDDTRDPTMPPYGEGDEGEK